MRSRACTPCAGRKARCDNTRPSCSECAVKGIDCHYPAATSKDAEPDTQLRNVRRNNQTEVVSLSAASSPTFDTGLSPGRGNSALDDGLAMSFSPRLTQTDATYINLDDPGFDFNNFLDTSGDDGVMPFHSSTPSAALVHQATHMPGQTTQRRTMDYSVSLSIPSEPSQSTRSLIQRPKFNSLKTATQRTAKLIFHTLKSYPVMMSRYNTLPPYIHPYMTSAGVGNDEMEPLNNCTSLLHMISARVQGSQKLFWRNVRIECERFCEEVCPAHLHSAFLGVYHANVQFLSIDI